MIELGDLKLNHTVFLKFTTSDADGEACSFDDPPAIYVFTDGTLVEITQTDDSITLTEDFDGETGLHQVQIDFQANEVFQAEKQYNVVLIGPVDGINVKYVLAHFSIESQYPYTYPTALTEITQSATMLDRLLWLCNRFMNKHTSDNFNGIRVYQEEDDTTLISQQAVSEVGGVKTVANIADWEAP